MLNHIVLMGRLTRDPELRRTGTGIPVVAFTLAVDRDFASKDSGERETDFIDIVAWRSTAEFVSKYFSKGRMAVVSGRLQIRPWEDKDGNKRRSAEVVADNVYFGDSKKDSGSQGGGYQQGGYGQGGYNYSGAYQGGYQGGGYPGGQQNAFGGQMPMGQTGFGSAPSYPPSDYGELPDDDGDLPF